MLGVGCGVRDGEDSESARAARARREWCDDTVTWHSCYSTGAGEYRRVALAGGWDGAFGGGATGGRAGPGRQLRRRAGAEPAAAVLHPTGMLEHTYLTRLRKETPGTPTDT